jgi:putative nucleotidyltransferase with HDIG domain
MSDAVDYKRRVYAIRDLPTLPVIAQKVLVLADDDDSSFTKLAQLISSDQSLSVKILSLANSAYFGLRSKIGTVQHAAAVIGTSMLKQLSLSVLVYNSIGRGGKDRVEFWKHSFGAATAASLIAKRTGRADGEVSFVAGLVHDVGKIVIETYFPDEPDVPHTEVGGWIAERWGLPQPLINAIAHHHSTSSEHLADPIVACVQAADACAKLVLMNTPHNVPPEVFNTLKMTDAAFLEIGKALEARRTQIDSLLM